MNYKLIQATENDYDFCYELTKRNMYDLFCRHWGGWVDSEFRKGFVADNIQVIIINGDRIGYISQKENTDGAYLDNIQITPEQQGNGIGTRILVDWLAKHEGELVRLTTFEDNPAKRLYERLGFKVFEKKGVTIKMEKWPNKALHRTPTSGAGEL